MLNVCLFSIPFRTIVVSLLSHQVLLQNLYDLLLEEFIKQPEGQDRVTPVTSDPGRPSAGFLRYISMTNLAIILDLLLDSYRSIQCLPLRIITSTVWSVSRMFCFCFVPTGQHGTLTPGQV